MISKEDIKIFFVNKFNWLDPSPMATISINFTYALAKLGFDTTLIIRGNPDDDVNLNLKEKFNLTPIDNYRIKLFPRFNFFFIKTSTSFYFKAVKYILANLGNTEKSIVVTRNTNFLPYIYMLSKFPKITTVFEAHGYHGGSTLPELPPKPPKGSVRLSRQFKIIESVFLNKVDGLVCITSPQQKLYQKDFVNMPTIFLPLASPNLKVDKTTTLPDLYRNKKLCYAGRLTPHVNPQMLFEALNLLEDQSIRFVWIGLKPSDIPILKKEIKKFDLENRVELKGWLPHNEMSQYLQKKVSVGFVGYKPTFRSAAVTSPSKIFDYFAAGLAIIAPRLANVEDIIEDGKNGLLFEPDNAQSLAHTINRIFADPIKFKELQKASFESAQKYSWQNRANKFIEFVDSL